jgi:hypothetical protein
MDGADSSDDELYAAIASSAHATSGPPSAESPPPPSSLVSPPSLWSSSDDDEIPESGYAGEDAAGDDERWIGTQAGGHRARPKLVGSFVIGAKLGSGAYATVREALNTDTLRIVAAKVVDLKKLRRVKGGLENIQREIRVQKALKKHPNLVELIHVHHDAAKARTYLFLEIASGCTVDELLQRSPEKRLCPAQVGWFLFQACTGLLYMHRRGIVHRDVKPGNMLLNPDGKLKIADFGVAEFLDQYNVEDNVTRTSGSPAFQAPEIAKGDDEYSGMKVDVWALGVTAYQLLTGHVPFNADNLVDLFAAISAGEYEDLPDTVGDASVREAVQIMLAVDWRERASVEQLLKHPWIARAEQLPTAAQQMEDGWVAVPRKQFSVLDLAERMVYDGKLSGGAADAMAQQLPRRQALLASRGSLKSIFGPTGGTTPSSAAAAAAAAAQDRAASLRVAPVDGEGVRPAYGLTLEPATCLSDSPGHPAQPPSSTEAPDSLAGAGGSSVHGVSPLHAEQPDLLAAAVGGQVTPEQIDGGDASESGAASRAPAHLLADTFAAPRSPAVEGDDLRDEGRDLLSDALARPRGPALSDERIEFPSAAPAATGAAAASESERSLPVDALARPLHPLPPSPPPRTYSPVDAAHVQSSTPEPDRDSLTDSFALPHRPPPSTQPVTSAGEAPAQLSATPVTAGAKHAPTSSEPTRDAAEGGQGSPCTLA